MLSVFFAVLEESVSHKMSTCGFGKGQCLTDLTRGTLPKVTEIMATSSTSGEALKASSKAKTSSTPMVMVMLVT